MGTKSFFNKQKSQETSIRGQEKLTIQDLSNNVESVEYVKQYTNEKLQFLPELDFSDPANFVKYGSARDYYSDLVDSVVQSYPYDGSLAERLRYKNNLVAIQKHELENNYPKATGYANFSDNTYNQAINPITVGPTNFGFGESNTPHYILTDNYSNELVYSTGSGQVGSVQLDFTNGVTVEFWLKKDSFPNVLDTENETIFSVSNTEDDLFQIVTDVNITSALTASFSKTNTFLEEFVFGYDTGLATLADSTWHHYALTFFTSSNGYGSELYVDGRFKEKKFITKASPALYLTGTLDATIAASSLSNYLGDGKLLGYLDEVRLWKEQRDAKEIGVNYFYDVGGGGNTDNVKVSDESPLKLSLYYKFNEGITGDSELDSVVLDYSGRLTNGVWVGYSSNSRETGSAITDSGVATESGNPIIYSTHPDVVSYKEDKIVSGSAYDAENMNSMYDMIPQWIKDDDAANGLLLRKLIQVMSSYLDTLHAQITAIAQLQDGSYVSGSYAKPNPYSKRNLISYGFDIPDIFIDTGVIEEIYFKDEQRLYEDKLFNLKNLIFQNIFNNLNFINKTKGTENSFRNLFRCFGVDNELVRLNMYSDNELYEIKENYETSQVKRNVIDLSGFNDSQSRSGVVFQFADPAKSVSETGDSGYIPSSSNEYIPLTFEAQVQFPKQISFPGTYLEKLDRCSIFGVHSASSDTTQTTIPAGDLYFKVYADTNSIDKTQFVLQTNIASVGTLTSSFYEDVNDNSTWTFAVRTKAREYPFASEITASDVFDLEFYGVNYVAGYKLHEFSASAEVDLVDDIGQFITGSNKRVYVGADKENITGSLNYYSNARVISTRVWFDYLTNTELQNHARDVSVYGRLNPYQNSFVYEGTEKQNYIPKIKSLALHWDFENVTGSDSSGEFIVKDITSGSSTSIDNRFSAGEYSKLVGPNYSGKGSGFSANSTEVSDFLFVDSAQQQLPENLYSSNLVEIREGDDTLFTRESRPSKYYFAVETSLYDTISRNVLGFFASIEDFNNLIGEPVNLYRTEYKDLKKLRSLFFENIENEPDLDKFVNLYKWLDGALDSVISNLIPASARTSEKVRNIVENHILERSKYQRKYFGLKEYNKDDSINGDDKTIPTVPNDLQWEGYIPPTIFPTNFSSIIPIINPSLANNIVNGVVRGSKRIRERKGLRPDRFKEDERARIEVGEITAPQTTTINANDQENNPLWWRLRAERGPNRILSTGVDASDRTRIANQINSAQIASASLITPVELIANAQRAIGTDVGFAGENVKNYFPSSFLGGTSYTSDGLEIEVLESKINNKGQPYYDYDDAIDETYNNNKRTPTRITDLAHNEIVAGQNYLPFDVLSASEVVAPYQQELFDEGLEVKIESAHRDYVVEGSTLQGPYTEERVGGWQYRHGNLFITSSVVRKEGYSLIPINSTTLHLNNPRFFNDGGTPTFSTNKPYGAYLRDFAGKNPVMIKNVEGSNYFYDYEIVETGGRIINNRYYVKSDGYTGTINDTSNISYDDAGVFFFKDFQILNRDTTGSNEFVIVNRFSAPGGPEVNSYAYLDVESAEYSIYNNLNYRNLIVRLENNSLLTRHMLSGGYDSVLLQPTASFYKEQRNGIYKLSASFETPEPVWDNSYVSYAIPRTDVQYAWVASSWIARKTGYPNSATLNSTDGLLTASGPNPYYGQNQSDFDYNISSSDYSPIYGYQYSDNIRTVGKSHIEYGVGSGVPVSVAFNGTNYVIVGKIDLDQNLFTTASTSAGDYYNLPTFDATTASYLLNGLLLSNNGPYQHPTFKQIRHGEHRVGREFRRKNIYKNEYDVWNEGRSQLNKNGREVSITQAPVTSKYKAINQYVDQQTGTLRYTFANEFDYFANVYDQTLDKYLDKNADFNVPGKDFEESDFYKLSRKFDTIVYSERVYPREENEYRDIARNRENYLSFWRNNNLEDRIENVLTNSLGYVISASYWSIDVSPSGSGEQEKSGELMRNTGSTGAGLAEGEANARYSFHMGECRPNNLVQVQAGTGAFYNTYGEFSTDVRLIGQDETIIPEFVISDYIGTIINQYNKDFLNEEIYGFTLTGSQNLTNDAFLERYTKTDEMTFLKELKENYGEPTAIRLSFDTTKKLLPREGFYPQQRVIQLAQQFSSSHSNSKITIGNTTTSSPDGLDATYSTTLLPFWAPGVGFNSIKTGFAVEFPYKSTGSAAPTGGINHTFDTAAPFESILSPGEYVNIIMHIVDSGSSEIQSTASVNSSDGVYEMMSHNFFAEVPEFFLEDLANFKSSPSNSWQFEGPLSSSVTGVKKFAMDIYIEDPINFLMYGDGSSFGPFPYNNHAPPGYYWNTSGVIPGDYCTFMPNISRTRPGYTKAKIVFDPTNLLSTDGRLGKTSFTLQDIIANSTIEHTNFLVERDGQSPADTVFMTLSASLDLFVQTDDERWVIRSKWECPILNFSEVTAQTYGSGTAIKGMWHQYGELAGSNARARMNVRIDDAPYRDGATTGSLAEAVGFERKAIPFGRIKPRQVIEEAICAIPFFINPETEEEKYFEMPINIFENRYSSVRTGQITQDSISDMIEKMDKFVLPPVYDFVHTRDKARQVLRTKKDFEPAYPPFSMYFFEFSSELDQQDLANIWQGVMPSIATVADKEKVILEHQIVDGELLSPSIFDYNGFKSIPDNIRWKIFKVKKRASYDYYKMLQDKTQSPTYKRFDAADRFSFNYPYDYFSLIELGKMQIDFEVKNNNPSGIRPISGGGYVSPEEARRAAIDLGSPTIVTSQAERERTAINVEEEQPIRTREASTQTQRCTPAELDRLARYITQIQASQTFSPLGGGATPIDQILNDRELVDYQTLLRKCGTPTTATPLRETTTTATPLREATTTARETTTTVTPLRETTTNTFSVADRITSATVSQLPSITTSLSSVGNSSLSIASPLSSVGRLPSITSNAISNLNNILAAGNIISSDECINAEQTLIGLNNEISDINNELNKLQVILLSTTTTAAEKETIRQAQIQLQQILKARQADLAELNRKCPNIGR